MRKFLFLRPSAVNRVETWPKNLNLLARDLSGSTKSPPLSELLSKIFSLQAFSIMKFQIISFVASLALVTQVLAVPQDAARPVPTCVLHCELPIILSIASFNKYTEQAVVHMYVPSFSVLYIIDTYLTRCGRKEFKLCVILLSHNPN